MKIMIDFPDFEEGTKEADVLLDWISGLIRNRDCDNSSPLKYANSVVVMPEG